MGDVQFSVVIPTRDVAPWIAEQLVALADQLPHDGRWEVIVADNGSSDRTVEVVRGFADRLPGLGLAAIAGEPGAGPVRNRGAEGARGEWLVFVDGDDVVLPGWCVAWEHAADDGLDLAAGSLAPFDGRLPDDPEVRSEPSRPLGFWPIAPSGNMLVRRATFMGAGGFDTSFARSEDVELSWRLQAAGARFRYVPAARVAYRARADVRARRRQEHWQAYHHAALYRRFRPHGLARPPLGQALRSYGGLVVRLPVLWHPHHRALWLHHLARRTGRLRGSLAARTFVP